MICLGLVNWKRMGLYHSRTSEKFLTQHTWISLRFLTSGNPAQMLGRCVCVKRAWKRFIQQETMMNDLMTMHKAFFKILEGAEATFEPSPYGQSDALTGTFAFNCGRQFTTAQGLATHKRQAHKEFSLEHDLLEGTACPECSDIFGPYSAFIST